MSKSVHHSFIDRVLIGFDQALRTVTPGASQGLRQSPAAAAAENDMSDTARKHAAGLMRINHTGEVCAQALYQGQAATAKLRDVR